MSLPVLLRRRGCVPVPVSLSFLPPCRCVPVLLLSSFRLVLCCVSVTASLSVAACYCWGTSSWGCVSLSACWELRPGLSVTVGRCVPVSLLQRRYVAACRSMSCRRQCRRQCRSISQRATGSLSVAACRTGSMSQHVAHWHWQAACRCVGAACYVHCA